ncbi:nardilysin-like [Patiria miniata]|uniref:Nardilysin n=1 Tax=Patiria miniata TaxID=46514 RepID=A0A913ZXC2_PATMI|nr:nardilysin-like [Patiria miniata]
MAAIVKSPNDTREYRVVTLSNGLTALLISDLAKRGQGDEQNGAAETNSECRASDDERCENDEIATEEMDVGSTPGDCTIGSSEVPDVNSDALEDGSFPLSDGGAEEDEEEMMEEEEDCEDDAEADEDAEARSVRKSQSKQPKLAAAALSIGIGSFCEPDDIPGLAHFLEHMVFMGSEKYPDENSFDAFIRTHGGSDNASTDCERTTFIFEVHQQSFREGLMRFAQFFTAPLLKASSTDRELEAVDSEFQMSLPSDYHRKQQLVGAMCREGHPMGKFMWGNSTTLKTQPSARNIDVQQRLIEFRKRVYSAQYMTVALQSRETLDTLEDWVRESFSDIPNNGQKRPSSECCGEPFSQEKLHKLYKVVPVQKAHILDITWSLANQRQHYRCKPLNYLSWLIGHEGHGSILALLKKRALALSLFSGNSDTGFEHNDTHAMYAISITLTDQGFNQVKEVLAIVFQYIKMLQTIGPQERIFQEIKTIDDNDFRFKEETEPIEYVEMVAESMQLYPTEECLTGPLLQTEYNPQAIALCTDHLQVHNANFMLLSKHFEGQCDRKELWYQTDYRVEDVPEEWKNLIQNLELNPELHLPEPNKFIATNFDLKSPDVPDSDYPVCILDCEQSKLWYKRDTKFNSPRGYLIFHLITPLVYASPGNLVLFDFLASILEHNLSEIGYEADAAQLEYSFKTEETGLVMKMYGFNHKLPLLFDTILDYIANFSVTQELFDAVKESMIKSYYNHVIKPGKLNNDVRLSILQQVKWTPVDKRSVVNAVAREQVLEFAVRFKELLFIEGLVQGNFTAKEALGFTESLSTKLGCTPLPKVQMPKTRVVRLPSGGQVCKVKGYNEKDANSVVTNYYQAGPGTIRRLSVIDVLITMMEEPCFDILRTQEQLGYSVYPTCRNSFGILGFSVTVATQATKFSVSHVEERIDSFLQSFLGKMRTSSSMEKDFKTQVESLITLKQCVDNHLGEEVDQNWWEVLNHTYIFDRLKREVEALRSVSLQEVQDFLCNHIQGGVHFQKLSSQVVGVGKLERHNQSVTATETMTTVDGITNETETNTRTSLVFLPLDETDSKKVVDAIDSFKASLTVYPVTKIDH